MLAPSCSGLSLHPRLVHFSLVLWFSLPVFGVLTLCCGPQPWWSIVLSTSTTGVVIGISTLMTGLLDYIYLSKTGSNDVRQAIRRGVRMTVVRCAMSIELTVATLPETGQPMVLLYP